MNTAILIIQRFHAATCWVVVSLLLLAPVTLQFVVQQLVVIPYLRKRFAEIQKNRAERVRLALASASTGCAWTSPSTALNYPFAGWVELTPDGFVKAAGQSFPSTRPFNVVAKDERHIPRAQVSGNGKGEVRITSHGQSFVCLFRDNRWDVQQVNDFPA